MIGKGFWQFVHRISNERNFQGQSLADTEADGDRGECCSWDRLGKENDIP